MQFDSLAYKGKREVCGSVRSHPRRGAKASPCGQGASEPTVEPAPAAPTQDPAADPALPSAGPAEPRGRGTYVEIKFEMK